MTKPKISIITPTRNNKQLLLQCLSSIFNQTVSPSIYEVIIVDDFSSDNTQELVNRFMQSHKNLRFFKSPRRGVSVARNLGVKMAEGDIIGFVDSDMVLEQDWIKKILSFYKENKGAVGVSGTSANAYLDNIFSRVSQDIINNSLADERCMTLPTNNCSYKKRVIANVGGFSEDVIIGGEDAELSYRIAMAGYKTIRNKQIYAKHYQVSNLRKFLKQAFFYGYTDHWFKMKHRDFFGMRNSFDYINYSAGRFLPTLFLSNLNSERKLYLLDFSTRCTYLLTYGIGAVLRVVGWRTNSW